MQIAKRHAQSEEHAAHIAKRKHKEQRTTRDVQLATRNAQLATLKV